MEVEIDPNFEPQSRLRANTWPARPAEFFDDEGNKTPNSTVSEGDKHEGTHEEHGIIAEEPACSNADHVDHVCPNQKKGGARRNAWGNLSYADLITKAINSTVDKRLTLSQIYDWMVQNVPYFRDKGDSNSSAGWKNSIRHNLSLHSRFVRVQNEGTGKSSWWIVNPEAKNSKAPRRRVASMDTKAMKEKRVRAKRKVDQLRSLQHGQPFSGSASDLASGYSLSPGAVGGDYRQRTSSNASSMGRLSPIHYLEGLDSHNLSPGNWNDIPDYSNPASFPDTITESFAELLVGNQGMTPQEMSGLTMVSPNAVQPQQNNFDPEGLSFLQQLNSYENSGSMPNSNNGYAAGYASGVTLTAAQQQQLLQIQQQQQQLQQQMQSSRRIINHPHSLSELLEQPDTSEDELPSLHTQAKPVQHITLPRYTNATGQAGNPPIKTEVLSPGAEQQQVQSSDDTVPPKDKFFRNLTSEQRNMLTTSLLRQVLTDQLQLQQRIQYGITTTASSTVPNPSSSPPTVAQSNTLRQQAAGSSNGLPFLDSHRIATNGALQQALQQPVNGHGVMSSSGGQMLDFAATQLPQIKVEEGQGSFVPDDLQNLDFSSLPDLKNECDDLDEFLNQEFSLGDPMDFTFDPVQANEAQSSDASKYPGFL